MLYLSLHHEEVNATPVLLSEQDLIGIYIGGLAWMVISPKYWEFLPFFMSTLGIIQAHLKSF